MSLFLISHSLLPCSPHSNNCFWVKWQLEKHPPHPPPPPPVAHPQPFSEPKPWLQGSTRCFIIENAENSLFLLLSPSLWLPLAPSADEWWLCMSLKREQKEKCEKKKNFLKQSIFLKWQPVGGWGVWCNININKYIYVYSHMTPYPHRYCIYVCVCACVHVSGCIHTPRHSALNHPFTLYIS